MVYEYYGAGEVATIIAQLDAIEVERRALERYDRRLERDQFLELVRTPPELVEYHQAVRQAVDDVLQQLGFHQHKRQWRQRRTKAMTTALEPTAQRARDLYAREKLTKAEQQELRGILSQQTARARAYGDMARVAWSAYMTPLGTATPGLRVAVEERTAQMRQGLGYDESSELERLLIDEIVLCHFDYYRIQRTYAIQTADSFKLAELREWDKILRDKQERHLRAIESLARVRRLLNLPAPQVNINLPGGQQLNVGELHQ